MTKPNINPSVERFLFSEIDSGNNSRDATVIIAPAAKDKRMGKILLMAKTSITPITADIGSTKAEACPIKKLFFLENPSFLRGSETAAPSGKF